MKLNHLITIGMLCASSAMSQDSIRNQIILTPPSQWVKTPDGKSLTISGTGMGIVTGTVTSSPIITGRAFWPDIPAEEKVKALAKSGDICKVFGHQWNHGRMQNGPDCYADYHPNIEYRTCKICGKREVLTTEWKE